MADIETKEKDLLEEGYEKLEPAVAKKVFPQEEESKYPVTMSVSAGVAAGTAVTAPIAIASGGGAAGLAGYAAGFGALSAEPVHVLAFSHPKGLCLCDARAQSRARS